MQISFQKNTRSGVTDAVFIYEIAFILRRCGRPGGVFGGPPENLPTAVAGAGYIATQASVILSHELPYCSLRSPESVRYPRAPFSRTWIFVVFYGLFMASLWSQKICQFGQVVFSGSLLLRFYTNRNICLLTMVFSGLFQGLSKDQF